MKRPFTPSDSKLGREKRVSAVEWLTIANNPLQEDDGWDVSDWMTVLITVHPSTPAFNSITLLGAHITLRVWRWRKYAFDGSGSPQGQWYADEDINLDLAGDAATGRPQETMLLTKNAERLFLQCVDLTHPNAATIDAEIGVYGIGEPREEGGVDPTPYNVPEAPSGGGGDGGAAALMDPFTQDSILSNLNGDFTATYTTAQRIRCVGTFEVDPQTWLDSSYVLAVGAKPQSAAGTETEATLLRRGIDLDCAVVVVNATTFDIYLDTPFWGANDDIIVYISGPRHRYEVTGIDGFKRQRTRDEAFTIATQSNRIEEIDPLDQRYVPDILADGDTVAQATTVDFYLDMAGYRYMTIQWIPSDANFTLKVYSTNEDNGTAPAACVYGDVTNAWFGAASYIATAYLFLDVPTIVKYVHIEVVRAGAVGNGTHQLFARRGW
jgi:hypothetical protein